MFNSKAWKYRSSKIYSENILDKFVTSFLIHNPRTHWVICFLLKIQLFGTKIVNIHKFHYHILFLLTFYNKSLKLIIFLLANRRFTICCFRFDIKMFRQKSFVVYFCYYFTFFIILDSFHTINSVFTNETIQKKHW